MQAKYRWLLLPPALALVLFLGPLRSPGAPAPAGTAGEPEAVSGTTAIAAPDTVQMISTLVGVLLLGVAGVLVLARFTGRGRGARGMGELLSVRQSIRLSGRHTIHAVQFNNELLLVGECDGSLSLLQASNDPQAAEDEAQATGHHNDAAADDEGAVPRNLVIPRPAAAPRRTAGRAPGPRAAASASPVPRLPADFQALLKLARKGS